MCSNLIEINIYFEPLVNSEKIVKSSYLSRKDSAMRTASAGAEEWHEAWTQDKD